MKDEATDVVSVSLTGQADSLPEQLLYPGTAGGGSEEHRHASTISSPPFIFEHTTLTSSKPEEKKMEKIGEYENETFEWYGFILGMHTRLEAHMH